MTMALILHDLFSEEAFKHSILFLAISNADLYGYYWIKSNKMVQQLEVSMGKGGGGYLDMGLDECEDPGMEKVMDCMAQLYKMEGKNMCMEKV